MLYALNDPLASFVFIDCIIVWKCMIKSVLRVRIKIYIRRYTESSVLHQLIRLLNCTHTQYPEIIEKVKYKTHTYFGFSYNVKEKYLGTYIYECTNFICYKCGRM